MTYSTRHRCLWDQCHEGGAGKPKRKTCGRCGSQWLVEQGTYGVFVWTGDGRYPASDAVRTFRTEASAEAYAVKTSPEYVVRWVYADDLDRLAA